MQRTANTGSLRAIGTRHFRRFFYGTSLARYAATAMKNISLAHKTKPEPQRLPKSDTPRRESLPARTRFENTDELPFTD
jgi:hypothetical protein